MEQIKPRKQLNFPLLLGILDAILLLGDSLFRNRYKGFLLVTILTIGITVLLSFFLTKRLGAGIAMIFWGFLRPYIPVAFAYLWGIDLIENDFLYSLVYSISSTYSAWLPVLAGILGILTLVWRKRAASFTEGEKNAFITKRSVFVIVSTFYLMIFLLFYTQISYQSSTIFHLLARTLGNDLNRLFWFFNTLEHLLNLGAFAYIFEQGSTLLWCCALLPSYLIYLGVHHPFSEKTNKPLCVIGTILTLITSICVIYQFSNNEHLIWNLLLVIISLACIFAGYFYFCKKLPEWSYVLVGCGFLIYAPLVLLAALLTICYFIFKLIFKDRDSTPQQAKKWEVTENGVTYTIEETSNGAYFDDCNREWKTDDGGATFYRKD